MIGIDVIGIEEGLGWISFTHASKSAMIPHCVKGSVYIGRHPVLYSTNLWQLLQIQERDGGGDGPVYNDTDELGRDESAKAK